MSNFLAIASNLKKGLSLIISSKKWLFRLLIWGFCSFHIDWCQETLEIDSSLNCQLTQHLYACRQTLTYFLTVNGISVLELGNTESFLFSTKHTSLYEILLSKWLGFDFLADVVIYGHLRKAIYEQATLILGPSRTFFELPNVERIWHWKW